MERWTYNLALRHNNGQWNRVNAFITKGKAYYTADVDLAKKAELLKGEKIMGQKYFETKDGKI